jgi:hypothetical protein
MITALTVSLMAAYSLYRIAHQARSIELGAHANVSAWMATFAATRRWYCSQHNNCLSDQQEKHMLRKTLITFTAAVALGCVSLATNALAAPPGHPGGHPSGHASNGQTRGGHYGGGYRGGAGYVGPGYVGPIYNSCADYGYGNGYYNNGCPGYGVPLVGGVINGILGGGY